jgi:hypothetical protein
MIGTRGGTAISSVGGEEDLVAGLASPYNPGGLVMRKRSGTSHAQKNSFKGQGMN